MVERPNGGVSVVLADGQSSGRGAKAVSTLVVRKVIALLAEGVRDGAAARAASDALFTEKNGKVIACLNILSVDLQSQTIVLSRNNPSPIYIANGDRVEMHRSTQPPIGTTRNIKPEITEIPLSPNLTIIMFTDGIFYRRGQDRRKNGYLQLHPGHARRGKSRCAIPGGCTPSPGVCGWIRTGQMMT